MFKLFFILVFISLSSYSQELKPAIEKASLRFTLPDALKKAGVKKTKCLFTDSRYLTWIGTENGLYRYDGTAVDYLRHYSNKEETLPNNNITGIAEDKSGKLWIGTLGGIAQLNPYSLQCKRYRQKEGRLKGDFDNKIFVDAEDKIWTGNSQGLEVYNSKDDKFVQVWHNDKWNGKAVPFYGTCLCPWRNDSLVLGTFADLVVINKKDFGFRRITLANDPVTVMDLALDPFGRLWAGTWGRGCCVFDESLNHYRNLLWPSKIDDSRILRHLSVVEVDGKKAMLLALGSGLLKIAFNNEGKALFDSTTYFESALEIENISSFHPVNAKTLLVAGEEGVANFSLLSNRFTKLPMPAKGSLQEPKEFSLGNHHYLVQPTWHSGQGLFLFDEENNRYKQFAQLPFGSREGTNISSFVPDSRGRFWCASFGGVAVLDANGKLIYDFARASGANALTRQKTNGLFIYHDTVWVTCYKAGIDLYNLDFRKLGHLDVNQPPNSEGPVWKITGDSKGRIWLCGNDALLRYLPAQKKFERIDFSEEKSGCMVNDLIETANGHLFAATSEGLVDFNPETGTYHFIRTPLLAKEDAVNSVTQDAKGKLWFLTETHLVCYDPARNRVTLSNEKDGIQTSNELQWVKTFDGHRFYLSQSNGVYRFSPDDWKETGEKPRLALHGLQVADSLWTYNDPPANLKLAYNQNKIYLEFNGINYEKPEENTYASLLQPLEKEWTLSSRNFVQYNNLSPGQYTLRLKVANGGQWSEEYRLSIHISPPFWLTWWFLGSTALLIGTLMVLFIRYISQRNLREKILVLEKQTAIEKERNRIAQDMHDDLGSGLTKIAILSEVAKTQLGGNETAVAPLQKISTSSRELVDSLQDIIWVLNPHNDSLENTAAYFREYALKFFESTATVVRFQFPPEIPSHKLSEEQRRNLFLVMKETLNNVAKHAAAATVDIALRTEEKKIAFSITDDGKGFDTGTVRAWSNGLRNMQQRMEQIGGWYCIKSEKGKGTATTLLLPL